MFNLEQSITNWRQQMLAAGIKTPMPLEELESHLREEIERQVKSGTSEQKAFETTVVQIGRACVLKSEFKKIENSSDTKIGVAVLFISVVSVLRVLFKHHEMGGPWKGDQIGWLLFSGILALFAMATIFIVNPGRNREIRLWQFAAIIYSLLAVWASITPIIRMLAVPKFSAGFGITERTLAFAAIAVSLVSVLGWRSAGKMLPAFQKRWARTGIGIACSLLGPAMMMVFIGLIMPHMGHFPAPLFFVLITWMWMVMAVLGGVGYGLAEATRWQDEAVES